MVLADVPELLIEVGKGAAVFTAIIAAGTALFKLKAVRWLWRKVMADPFGGWLARVITGVTDPGFAEVKANAKAQHDEQNERLDGINDRLDNVVVAVAEHTQRFVALESRSVTVTDTHITTTDSPPKEPS